MCAQIRPQVHAELVHQVVKAAHRDIDRVKELVEGDPTLARASYDRGGGDWESAVGGAAHMGERAIVEYLLSKGACMDIFVAAALGHADVVRAILMAQPEAANSKGPHGIDVLAHAKRGGSQEVVKLLMEAGARESKAG